MSSPQTIVKYLLLNHTLNHPEVLCTVITCQKESTALKTGSSGNAVLLGNDWLCWCHNDKDSPSSGECYWLGVTWLHSGQFAGCRCLHIT